MKTKVKSECIQYNLNSLIFIESDVEIFDKPILSNFNRFATQYGH